MSITLLQKANKPKVAIIVVFLLFICLVSYSYASIHVLSIGDWPHDVLRPTYGDSRVQTGWAPSLGLIPEDKLNRFDVVVIDTSVKAEYVLHEPYITTFTDYIREGGTLIHVVSKEPIYGGKILDVTYPGEGKIIEVVGSPNPQYRSLSWSASKYFWEDIFEKSVSPYRLLLLDILNILILGLVIVLGFLIFNVLRGKFEMIRMNKESNSKDEEHSQNKKHLIVVIIFFAISILMYSPWIVGLYQEKIPCIVEGLADITTISYFADYFSHYNSFPAVLDYRTYSQPTDILYYMRTPMDLFPSLFSLLFNISAFGSEVLIFILYTFFAMVIIYYLVYNQTKNICAPILSAILYVFTNGILISAIVQGHMRFITTIFLIPALFLTTNFCFSEKRMNNVLGFIAIPILFFLFLSTNAIIATLSLVIAIIFWIIINIRTHSYSRSKIILFIIVSFIPFLFYIISIFQYKMLLPSPFMTLSSYAWEQTPNLLQSLALNTAQLNKIPPELMSIGVNYLYTLVIFLPITASLISFFVNKKYIVLYLIGLMLILLSAGLYGPFAQIFLSFSIPFRAPGRTFLPVATFIFSFLSGVGLSALFANQKNNFRKVFVFCIIGLVLSVGLLTILPSVKTWEIPKEIESAYEHIPEGSRVLVIPIYGSISYGYSLSSPGMVAYRNDSSVGLEILHMHEYESNKHHLKDAFAPPSFWEAPHMTKWYFDMVNEKMVKWDDAIGALYLLNYAPDLQYLIVYKKIVPDHVLEQLNESNQLKNAYENELMIVYKRINSISSPIIESDKAFLLYTGSYRYSLPSVVRLSNGSIPVFMGETPWYLMKLQDIENMKNLTIVIVNTNTTNIATEYAISDTENRILINPENSLTFSEKYWGRSPFWQPSLDRYSLASNTISPFNITFNINEEEVYDIFIRTACNGPWRGSLTILLDNKVIGNGFFPNDIYGYRWFHMKTLNLSSGKHIIKLINTKTEWINIDAIAILKHKEYEENFEKYKNEFQAILSQKDYLSIYEAENSFARVTNAIVTDDWNKNWTTYPSGGWVKGQSIKTTSFFSIITIPIEIPLSKEYYITIREKEDSDGWNYTTYKKYLKEGTYYLNISNNGQITAWIDCIYVSNKPLSEILKNENPEFTLKTTDGSSIYYVNSSDNQPRYVLLMKSYFPLWKIISNGTSEKPYLANGFLNGFYVENKEYEIKFGK
jgi:hypothetical protein